MAKKANKPGAIELGPDSDPKILYGNYVKECKNISIEPYGPMKDALINEQNPNAGKQIIIASTNSDSNALLGSGGCRALINALIGAEGDVDSSRVPFTAIKEIRICQQKLGDGGAKAISTLLAATAKPIGVPCWKLEFLELPNNGIGRDGCHALGRSLCVGMNKTLSTLILDFNRIGTNGVAALCKGISTNSTLKKLSLKHCNIDEHGGKPIGEVLSFKKTALQQLDLTSNLLGGIGLSDICTGLSDNTSLKTLRLGDNSIGGQTEDDAKALEQFALVLAKHTSIVAVDLMYNVIGTEGGTLLLPAVRDNKQITEFKVDSKMDDELYKSLYRASTRKKGKKGKGKKGKKKK